jgi:uncharacterized repeat protein (TIGR01451 family)
MAGQKQPGICQHHLGSVTPKVRARWPDFMPPLPAGYKKQSECPHAGRRQVITISRNGRILENASVNELSNLPGCAVGYADRCYKVQTVLQIFSSWYQIGRQLFSRLGDGRVWALALVLAAASLPSAQAATRAFSPRFTLNAAGDITIAANSSLTCSTVTGATGAATCVAARNGTAAALTNNSYTMINMDVDINAGTVNSSAARLLLNAGSAVAFAGLYWGGVTNNAATTALRGAVALATPLSGGAYTTITASVTNDTAAAGTANGAYQSFADVTGIVASAGAGTYTVANVAATSGVTNVYAGWSLVVVFRDATQPTRNMVVYDGFQVVQNAAGSRTVDLTLTGFTTPPSGTVTSKLGLVAYEGDRSSTEGTAGLLFGTSTATLSPVFNTLNPQTDVFNSTISTLNVHNPDRNPNYQNTLGYDADILSPNTQLPNGATQAVVRVSTTSETIYPGVITLATNVFVPNIKDTFIKSVVDLNGGLVEPGDVLEYTVVFANTGNDSATNTVLIDAIPANTSYVTGSMVLSSTNSGMPTGPRTDAAGDDAAEFDAAGNRIVVRIGRTATAVLGGQLNPGDGQTLKFRVSVNASTPGETSIPNSASISYRALTLGTLFSDLSDSNPVTAGDQPATLTTTSADLTIAKTHAPAQFAQSVLLPATPTFSIVVRNSGTIATFGTVSVADILPAGMAALSIAGPGWTCTLATLVCIRTDALAPSSSYPTITLEVSASAAGSFTNTATVTCACEGASRRGNNTALDPVSVLPSASLAITKTNGVTSLIAGDTTSYTVTVANFGPSGAGGAVFTDPVVAGLSCTAVTCSVTGGAAACPAPLTMAAVQAGIAIATFPANSSLSFVIQCGVTATGQ